MAKRDEEIELIPVRCPQCGSEQVHECTVDQDMVGNDLRAIVCFDCEFVLDQQDHAGQCLHQNVERDLIGRKWCLECGDYLGER